MKTVLAADLGGTKCKFALITEDLRVIAPRVVPTERDRTRLLAAMDGAFTALRAAVPQAHEPPGAIGIGAAVLVPSDGAELEGSPNLPLRGFALREHLERTHRLPATILNDGRASAWGEYLRGNAQGCDSLVVLFFGTGIGIGVMMDGKPYGGGNNVAGEAGHMVHVPGGRQCVCGNRGCFEAYCGGGPMGARAAAELGSRPGGEPWSVADIIHAAADHAAAQQILAEAEAAACALVASLCTLLNPTAIVLGGGVIKGWPELAQKVETFTRSHCTAAATRRLVFARSSGGPDAILWGAAAATGAL